LCFKKLRQEENLEKTLGEWKKTFPAELKNIDCIVAAFETKPES
jgi:hypothetical protein